jgi:hypothetical protein
MCLKKLKASGEEEEDAACVLGNYKIYKNYLLIIR